MQGENGYYARLVLCFVFVSSVLSSSLPGDYVRFLLEEAARQNESPERGPLFVLPESSAEEVLERLEHKLEAGEEAPRRPFSRVARSSMMRFSRNDGGQARRINNLADLPVFRFG